jgi:hypothetical protein
VDISDYPTAAIYVVLAVLTAGFGVGMLVWQTGSTQHALTRRRGMITGGVLLILVGGLVLLTQIFALVSDSYGTIH